MDPRFFRAVIMSVGIPVSLKTPVDIQPGFLMIGLKKIGDCLQRGLVGGKHFTVSHVQDLITGSERTAPKVCLKALCSLSP
jgi:hypothetical protein